jgi:hypothetical protein
MPPFSRPAAAARRPSSPVPPPDPHLESILLHVDALDQELHDPRLLGGQQLVPDGGEIGEQACDLTLGDLVLVIPLEGSPRPGDQLTVGGQTFVIQGEPERRDPDRLVWTLDIRTS